MLLFTYYVRTLEGHIVYKKVNQDEKYNEVDFSVQAMIKGAKL